MEDCFAIMDEIASCQGWDAESKVEFLLKYIEDQGNPEAFRDFLETQAGEEINAEMD